MVNKILHCRLDDIFYCEALKNGVRHVRAPKISDTIICATLDKLIRKRSVLLLSKEGLGEVLLEKFFSASGFQRGDVNGYAYSAYISAPEYWNEPENPGDRLI